MIRPLLQHLMHLHFYLPWLAQTREFSFSYSKIFLLSCSIHLISLFDSNTLFSEEALAERTTVPSPYASSTSKKSPQKEPTYEALIVEAQAKTMTETKTKCWKKNAQPPVLSLEAHQAASSLNDISIFCCRSFEFAAIV
jgi:hypothetical protein